MDLVLSWGRRTPADPELITLERAIVEEIAELGFCDATIDGACARAGASTETFGSHFSDLEDAYCEVFHSLVAEIFARAVPAFEVEEGWRNQIRAVAYEVFRYIAEDRARARYLVVEVLSAGERAQSMREHGLALMAELIDQGRSEMEDPQCVTRATAEALAGAGYRAARIGVENDDLDPLALLPSMLYNIVLPYVGAADALVELTRVPPRALTGPIEPAERERLLRVLVAEVAENGRGATSATSVCARAELRPQDFSACFVDLEDALCQGLEYIDSQIVARAQAAVNSRPNWREQLRAAAYSLSDYLGEDLGRARFLMVEATEFGERAKLIRYDALQLAIDLIDQGRQELSDPGSLERKVAERAAVELFGSVTSALRAGGEGYADSQIRTFLRGLVEPYVGSAEAERELGLPRP
jgi:AcrR family transcriptional regulator